MQDIRQELRDMATYHGGIVVLHRDGTYDPERSAEVTARLLALAALDDAALAAALG